MKKHVNNALYYISKYNTYALIFMLLLFISKAFFSSPFLSLILAIAVYFVMLKTKLIVIESVWNRL
ncbi:hypothetical protein [Peptostreptococcus sp. D1]|uniref:hypothetical protein n=1 Tax=Peptostreptococcus sp. D1 TaxID=72304 RepID=UPI0008E1FD61|nr:hypothetical protein [Peptostreptococcus sp. D1]SFE34038.1 hypothetical protein SAMN02910278_00585 [Peptostreptococcus sp. D1]